MAFTSTRNDKVTKCAAGCGYWAVRRKAPWKFQPGNTIIRGQTHLYGILAHYRMSPIFIEFGLLAAGLGIAGFYLTVCGDGIAEKTGLGGTWVGLALMASVTSLPELVTGISAVRWVDAPNIALGDAIGSCVFNLILLVVLDFLHREAPVFTRVSQGHILAAGFSIMLLGLVGFNILVNHHFNQLSIGHVGLATPLIMFTYAIAVYTVFQYERKTLKESTGEIGLRYSHISLRQTIVRYILAASVVVLIGLRLPMTAEQMAAQMGWGQTFVGTLFVAMATSLPEVAVTLSALRIGALDMAMSDIFGSNLFDLLIVAIDDIAYSKGPLLANASTLHLISIQSAIMMTGIAIVGLLYRPKGRVLKSVGWSSLMILMLYATNMAVLYLSQAQSSLLQTHP
jgi:cation:H+ antiporter